MFVLFVCNFVSFTIVLPSDPFDLQFVLLMCCPLSLVFLMVTSGGQIELKNWVV